MGVRMLVVGSKMKKYFDCFHENISIEEFEDRWKVINGNMTQKKFNSKWRCNQKPKQLKAMELYKKQLNV